MTRWAIDDLDINDGVNYHVLGGTDVITPAPAVITQTAYGMRPGGVLVERPPGPRVIPLQIGIIGNVHTGEWQGLFDALAVRLANPYIKLRAGFSDDRHVWAKPANLRAANVQYNSGEVSVDFLCFDPYRRADVPSGYSGTLALAQEGSTTQRSQFLTVTPGGTAPAPLRIILAAQSGSVTATDWLIQNFGTVPPEAVAWTVDLAAGSIALLDPTQPDLMIQAATNILGYWPLEDESAGPFLDFSTNSRDLTVSGTVTAHEDGYEYSAVGITGGSYLVNTASALGPTGDMSAGVWVWFDAVGAAEGVMGKASANKGWVIRKTAADVFEVSVGNTTTSRTATGTRTVEVGVPYLVGFSYISASGTLSLYVNASQEAQTTGASFTTLTAGVNDLRIGNAHNIAGTAEAASIRVAEPFVMNAALTATQWLDVMRYGPVGYNATAGSVRQPVIPPPAGALRLHPAWGGLNTIKVSGYHGSSNPAARLALAWRSRYL